MTILVPILFVVFTWWFSTGVVLLFASRENAALSSRQMHLAAMLALGAAGLAGVAVTANPHMLSGIDLPRNSMAYTAFLSALFVWTPIEYTFLTGLLTGPRVLHCPPGTSDRERFGYAFQALSHHEYALAGALVVIGLITIPTGNIAAFATFLVLWLMRLSAKFTLFSGAPRFAIDMMPKKIAYLQSYIRHDRIGPFFWVAMPVITAAFIGSVLFLSLSSLSLEFKTLGIMLTTLLGLGVLEHWFMILPVADSALWRWALPGTGKNTKSMKRAAHHHSNTQRHLRVAPGYRTAQLD